MARSRDIDTSPDTAVRYTPAALDAPPAARLSLSLPVREARYPSAGFGGRTTACRRRPSPRWSPGPTTPGSGWTGPGAFASRWPGCRTRWCCTARRTGSGCSPSTGRRPRSSSNPSRPATTSAVSRRAPAGDAHARNYSVLLRRDGTVELAPLYDLVSTRFYRRLDTEPVQLVDGVSDIDAVRVDHLVAEAERWGVPIRAARARVESRATRVLERLDDAARVAALRS